MKVTCNDGVSHRGAISFGMVQIPAGNEGAVWVTTALCCTVKHMEKTESGGLRQPVFKGIREDKVPEDRVEVSYAK